jgi:hypothetical protein
VISATPGTGGAEPIALSAGRWFPAGWWPASLRNRPAPRHWRVADPPERGPRPAGGVPRAANRYRCRPIGTAAGPSSATSWETAGDSQLPPDPFWRRHPARP